MMPLALGWPPLDVRYSEVTGAAWRSEGPSQRGDLAFAAPHAAPSAIQKVELFAHVFGLMTDLS